VHNRTSDDGNGLLDRQVDPVDIGWRLTLPTGATLFSFWLLHSQRGLDSARGDSSH